MLGRTLFCAAILIAPIGAAAQALRIGVATEATSLDPHFFNISANNDAMRHLFDTLVDFDEDGRIVPALAASWRQTGAAEWEIALRPGIVFSDGSALTAEDVTFSLNRAATLPNAPASYRTYLAHVASTVVVDALTLRIGTGTPYPFLMDDLGKVAIVSRTAAATATTADFNGGKPTIGTGPFRLEAWVSGDRLNFRRNERYRGPAPIWAEVAVRPLVNSGARTAALLSGAVDMINAVPPADIAQLRGRGIATVQKAENRILNFAMDQASDQPPGISAADGQPPPGNPLKDARVRRAISKAIDRAALVERVLDGVGVPAGGILPQGESGRPGPAPVEQYDPAGARRLLAEAGYPAGFRMTVSGPNDRYLNDALVVQAVAQMLTRVGIATKVETLPQSVYFSRLGRREFSFALVGTGSTSGSMAYRSYNLVRYMFATPDLARGLGGGNSGRYSNPAIDSLVERAGTSPDPAERDRALGEAVSIAIDRDLAVMPLFYSVNVWGTRQGFGYVPRTDGQTLAVNATR